MKCRGRGRGRGRGTEGEGRAEDRGNEKLNNKVLRKNEGYGIKTIMLIAKEDSVSFWMVYNVFS